MSGVKIVSKNQQNKILEQKYIIKVLNQTARDISKDQNKTLARFGSKDANTIKARRKFIVSNNKLEFKHLMLQRFIDMRRIRGQRQKAIPVHNKIIYSNFNQLIKKLAYGFTQDVKNELSQEINITM